MKVRGPGSSKDISKSDKKSGASKTGNSDFSSMVDASTGGASAPTNTQSIAQLDALLAIQGAEDPTERKSRGLMHARADDILGKLEQVRIKMLGGNLTVGDMIDVADVVASHREKISDPALTDIMDEVDLRAQVEIAKMRAGLDKQQKNKD